MLTAVISWTLQKELSGCLLEGGLGEPECSWDTG